jgi:Methyltransferase domain
MKAADGLRGATAQCKICGMQSEFFDEAQVLRKYVVKYSGCTTCGFFQTETPCWLQEAYSTAISSLDTGILSRNLANQRLTAAVLNLLYPSARKALDFGAGHGIFVRLMRDNGFEFFWYDPHASNDYAGGFEHEKRMTYDFLTSFEVLEHLVDPYAELSTMMSLSPNVFVSTSLVPRPAPRISDWGYYGPDHGQHVSFYTLDALQLIAGRFGRNLLSCGSLHLFTVAPKSRFLFGLATSQRASRILNAWRRRPSLADSDQEAMSMRETKLSSLPKSDSGQRLSQAPSVEPSSQSTCVSVLNSTSILRSNQTGSNHDPA